MRLRIVLFGLFCGLLGAASGCRIPCGTLDCGLLCPPGFCDPEHCVHPRRPGCGPVCEEDSSPVCGVGGPRLAGCGPCGEAACGDACGPGCGPGCGRPGCHPIRIIVGPLGWVVRLFTHDSYWGPSCGERYWGDWLGDPPDCCDPCDRCGNFTGVHVGRRMERLEPCCPRPAYEDRAPVEFNTEQLPPFDGTARVISQSERVVASGEVAATPAPRSAQVPRPARRQ